MKVTIDPRSGFCFGVTHAIEFAESELNHNGHLFCLGDIVHNNLEVDRLKSLGLTIIGEEEFKTLHNNKVLIRAHGEPPETYKTAFQNNIELIDATCPIVLNLQKQIRQAYLEMVEKNGQIAIYGKKGHAEVIGLAGQTNGRAIVIGNEKDLDMIDFSRPVRLYSQTTMDTEGFLKIVGMIGDRIKDIRQDDHFDFSWRNTICRQVSNRSVQLVEFAKQYQVVVFVSGKKSSNGMYLYDLCRSVNPRTYLVSGKEDLQMEWFNSVRDAGICGATSTPKWLLEEIGEEVKSINNA
jgi:4-hydroxy-3-methylbut-2-en-1-yl diphosphate reductase